MTPPSGWARSLLVALVTWFGSRLVLGCIGALATAIDGHPVHWVSQWVQWDANYYLSILEHGYREPSIVTGMENGQSNLNFFPLLPLGGWITHQFVRSPILAGLAFANTSLIVAAIGLHRVASRRFGRDAADWSVLALMTLPGSFMLSGVMTEPLFLALSIWSYHFFSTERRGAAAAVGSLLSVTRLTGVVLAAGFAIDWLVDRVRQRPASYATLFATCLMPLPLIGYMIYMDWLTGDGLAFLHSMLAFWQQRMTYPFANFFLFLSTDQPRLVLQSALALVMLLCLAGSLRSFSLGEIVFVVVNIASFASSESASPSLLRYMLSLYPLYLAVGRGAGRSPAIRMAVIALAMVNGALMTYWARGYDLVI